MRNESGLLISRKEIASRFSVDEQAQKFRVEFYHGANTVACFCSTFQKVHAWNRRLKPNRRRLVYSTGFG
jgi:hypothetical protein